MPRFVMYYRGVEVGGARGASAPSLFYWGCIAPLLFQKKSYKNYFKFTHDTQCELSDEISCDFQ